MCWSFVWTFDLHMKPAQLNNC